jgi:NADH-quinone oxidoreductase subunit N
VTGVLADSAAIPAPSIEYGQLVPMLVVFGAAIVGVLVEAFAPRRVRLTTQLILALGSLAAAFILTIVVGATDRLFASGSPGHVAAMGAVAVDRPTLFIQGTIVILAFVSVLLIGDTSHSPFAAQAAATPGSQEERESLAAGIMHTEIFPLTLFAVGGMMLFPASNDLLTMFVALEVLSLPLYLLCGLARRRRLLSNEAAVKYFLLGAFSSALFLFGIAMLYGFSGSVRLSAIASAAASNTSNGTLLLTGIALTGVGLLFKVGAVPFQGWKPDVYQGAPTPITALMASCTVVSAFGALLRVFYVAFGNLTWDWRPAMWVVAVLTMVVGAVVAITQTDVKRLLAYSSIAHAGFILTAVIAVSAAGLSSSMFYLAAYGFTTVGAFAVITLVRDPGGEAGHLSRWAGLGRRSPLVAGIFALFLLAFAGIPLTSGFTGKFAVFQAAIASGATALVIVGVLSSAIAAFFYVRVIVLMFFSDPIPDGPEVVVPTVFTGTAIGLGAAVTVVLGIVPQPILNLASHAANQLFVGLSLALGQRGFGWHGTDRAYSGVRGVRACR